MSGRSGRPRGAPTGRASDGTKNRARVLLIRHAEAGERSEWRGKDRDRPLTAAGQTQAARLAALVEGQPVTRVLTSGFVRCVETVAPLAARLALVPEVAGWLEEGADPSGALSRLLASGDAVACSHGDVVSGILFELADRGIGLGSTPRMQKGSTWIIDVAHGEVASARYLPPPP